ncbi:MAG: class I fructose-bisphosphate aldolase family protein [Candidatus Helarchaeota archaeon]|nr:class I fructose-bisphosphate aldolase family protein [Candidatus Helarchaeota archaeon]
MSLIGKAIRLERIINRETKRTIIVPMDHGMSVGPIKGLEDMGGSDTMKSMVDQVAEGGADAVLGHLGLPIYGHRKSGKDVGLIIHLSASTSLGPSPNSKILVTTVEEAIKIGADACSIHINIGDENEAEMLRTLGTVSRNCREWGFPLLAMMYPRGKKIEDEHNVEHVKIVARVAAELGVDIVKTNYTGSIETFKEVTKGCGAPVIIAGGPKKETTEELLQTIKDSLEAGGVGVAIGRNIFQAENPTKVVRAIYRVVHENWGVSEALKELK